MIQSQMCQQYNVPCVEAQPDSIFGFATDSGSNNEPLHGLRHDPSEGTSGWYIWRGEYSAESDFFKLIHVKHASERCPESIPYLGLPPGLRFLIKDEYVDVWFDRSLLNGSTS